MKNARRHARVIAMQALYELDAVGGDPAGRIDALAIEQDASREARTYAQRLVQGVLQRMTLIDALIQDAAPQWPLAQVAGVDKAILRVATHELRYESRVPPRAVINEAIEIAKEYGGESSGRFVNGVLGHVMAVPAVAVDEVT